MSLLTSDGATLRAFADGVLRAAVETLEEVIPVTLAVIGGVLAEAEPDPWPSRKRMTGRACSGRPSWGGGWCSATMRGRR